MYKTLTCTIENIPINSIAEEDYISSTGALLIAKGTTITRVLKDALKDYKDEVSLRIYVPDDVAANLAHEPIFDLTEAVKKRAAQGVEYMYTAKQPDEIVHAATDVSDELVDSIMNSKTVSVNLNRLKISDDYTFKHSVDVATLAALLAKKLRLSDIQLQEVTAAGILHDIGKTDVPDEILNAPRRLSDEEFELVKRHPVYGYRKIADSEDISEAVKKGVLMHHERYVGGGYPLGVSGEQINFIGRILSVVDVFDALVTERPYHKKFSPITAYEMLLSMVTQLDPEYVRLFSEIIILYPVGELLLLSNGATCIVIKQNPGYPLRPVVQNVETKEIYNLMDLEYLNLVIL